jgi:hypothetical protein
LKFVGYDGPRRNFGAKIKQAYLWNNTQIRINYS